VPYSSIFSVESAQGALIEFSSKEKRLPNRSREKAFPEVIFADLTGRDRGTGSLDAVAQVKLATSKTFVHSPNLGRILLDHVSPQSWQTRREERMDLQWRWAQKARGSRR